MKFEWSSPRTIRDRPIRVRPRFPDINGCVPFSTLLGADDFVNDKVLVTGGLRYTDIGADVTLTGTALGNLSIDIDVNPFAGYVGIGARFWQ
jgi:hypothetical protein